ncbi:MAG: TonB-dependent receptor, partial [Phenylobacterium sp.]|uniref:TonB-dependent receptor domain-containing protein n=1 Tax=Phenylobacterium sp. TaxID=1871053 RepID=UPI00271C391F
VEMGADWERQLSARTALKLLALAARRDKGSSERYTTQPAAGAARSTFIRRESESGEYIGRATWTYRPTPGRSLELGAEGAVNYLESGLGIDVDVGRGRQPTDLPVANTRVEEVRGEIFLSQTSNPSDRLRIEKGVIVETSRITQSGDASQERTFTFVKPRFVATWTPSPSQQLRFRLERDVAQLDFSEFASAVSLFDGTVDLGNPDLEPERTWRGQIDWERRFGPKAVLTLTAFYERVEAVQDQIPVGSQFDAPGNLGDGWRAGGRVDALVPLDAIGLARAELRLRGQAQETRVDDPLTGQSRPFADEALWSYSIDLRQALPKQRLAWGALWEQADEVTVFRARELRSMSWDRANLDLYVETTAIAGLVIRLTAADVFLPQEVRERRFFLPDRSEPANLTSIETRRATGGYGTRSLTLRISGRF